MKKCVILFVVLCMLIGVTESKAQMYILNEDFSTATGTTPPANWQNTASAGQPGALWHFDNPGGRTVNFPVTAPFAILDAPTVSADTAMETVTLESPFFDASVGSYCLLFIDHTFVPDSAATAKIFAFDGTLWTEVRSFTAATANNPVHEVIDLTAVCAGKTAAKIRFQWQGHGKGWWALDNVRIYSPLLLDAGVSAIDSPAAPFAVGVHEVKVTLNNYGYSALTSSVIKWSVNGVMQPAFNWSGSISYGLSQSGIGIGTFDFQPHMSYLMKVWSDNANGVPELNHFNDTVTMYVNPALCGQYTIGGVNPDFPSFTAAAEVLNRAGVSCPVVFKVRNGIYEEQLLLNNIPGTSVVNTVTFESESGDSSAVLIKLWTGGLTTVKLNDTRYCIFNKLGIQGWSGLVLSERSSQIKITHCYFPGWERSLSIHTGSNNIIVSNNYFSGASHGVVYDGDGSYANANVSISGNIFAGQGYSAVTCNYIRGLSITDNIIDGPCNRAVHLYQGRTCNIEGNVIRNISSGLFLYLTTGSVVRNNRISLVSVNSGWDNLGMYCESSDTLTIYNNYIQTAGAISSRGIFLHNCSHTGIYYNSISIQNTDLSRDSKGLQINMEGQPSDIRNNIFSVTSGGTPVYIVPATLTSTLDYNDYYNPDGLIGRFNNTDYSSLQAWRSATGRDSNSKAENPYFSSSADPTVNQVLLNDVGTPIAGIEYDIDSVLRDPVHPDPGVKEFTPCAPDAGISSLLEPVNPIGQGLQNVTVLLQNQGSGALTSVVIHWSINGQVQSPYYWTGVLPYKQGAAVTLGGFNFASGLFSLTIWTTLPNGMEDCDHHNDTLHIKLVAPLCGVYTIGGVNPDFQNFSVAAEVLNLAGVSCPVVFKIRNGIYEERFLLTNIPGTSAVNTVTFESESGDSSSVTVKSWTNGLVTVQLKDTKYCVFNRIGFQGWCGLAISEHSSQIKVTHCHFPGWEKGLSMQTGSNNIIISNNYFSGASHGVTYDGDGNYDNVNISISGNIFTNQGYAAVNCNYIKGLSITNNIVNGPVNRGFHLYRLREITVDGNVVRNSSSGLFLYYSTGVVIKNNLISLLSVSSGLDNLGMYCESVDSVSIHNNFIRAAGDIPSKGLVMNGCYNTGIYYNSFAIRNTDFARESVALLIPYDGLQNKIKNNIFDITSGGYPVQINLTTTASIFDFNDYFHPDGLVGRFNSTSYFSLAGWGQAISGEANGKNLNPYFANDTSYKVYQRGLNGAGIPVASVPLDIEGEIRNNQAPDIGCDEFTVDFGITQVLSPSEACSHSGSDSLTVWVRQYGDVPFTNIRLARQINGGPVVYDSLMGTINNDIFFTFQDPVNISAPGAYTIKCWLVNNYDDNRVNDTVTAIRHSSISPAVSFTSAGSCSGQPVAFTGTATVPVPYGIVSYEWLFGDGDTAFVQNPVHTFTQGGTYPVSFRAWSDAGCYGESTLPVLIHPTLSSQLQVNASKNPSCAGDTVAFTATFINGGTNPQWHWEVNGVSVGFPGVNPLRYVPSNGDQVRCILYQDLPCPAVSPEFSNIVVMGVSPLINATAILTQDTLTACTTSILLQAAPGYNDYQWNTGESSSAIQVTQTGWYHCTVSNGGCTATDSLLASIITASIIPENPIICSESNITLSMVNPWNLPEGLLAWYPFNGNAKDESCQGNNGVVLGAELIQDRTGIPASGYHFNGSAYINLLSKSIPTDPDVLTECAWLKTTHDGVILSRRHDPYTDWSTLMVTQSKGTISCDAPGFISNVNTSDTIADGTWHFLAGVKDHNLYKVYFDGQLQGTTTINYEQQGSPFNLQIGHHGAWNNYFTGDLDDIGIYGRALSNSEIRSLYVALPVQMNYLWSTGETTASITVTPIQTTTYYCTVGNGISTCSDSVTVVVEPSNFHPVIFSQDTLTSCAPFVELDAGGDYFSYRWSTGDTIRHITAQQPGLYICTVSNGSCIECDSIYVNLLPSQIFPSEPVVCNGNPVTLVLANEAGTMIKSGEFLPGAYYDYDNFEDGPGSSDNWTERNGIQPLIVNSTAWSGARSLYFNNGWGRNYESPIVENGQPSGGYFSADYPYMSMAYKIPSTSHTTMLVHIGGIGWRGIAFTQGEQLSCYPAVASWNAAGPLVTDNQWHFKTINLHAQLQQIIGPGNYHVEAVIFHDACGAYNVIGEFWIDEFSISKQPPAPEPVFYHWSTGDTTALITVAPTVPAIYSCIVSNSRHNCVDSVMVGVVTFTPEIFPQDTLKVCATTWTLDAGPGYSAYQWSTGSTAQSVVADRTRWYRCTVFSSGCRWSDSVFVSLNHIEIVPDSTVICLGESATLTATGYENLYFEDFDGASVPYWTNVKRFRFDGSKVLGDYCNDSVQMDLCCLPDHDSLTIAFDFYAHDSWDYAEPFVFKVNGNVVSTAYFSAWSGGICSDPRFQNMGQLPSPYNSWYTYKYHAVLKVPHTGPDFVFSVAQTNGEGYGNESWSLDNFSLVPGLETLIWSTGDTTATITVSPALTTTYFCTVSNGISSCTDSVTVIVTPGMAPTLTGPQSVCAGSQGNVYTTEAGMNAYQWTVSAGGTITAGGGPASHSVTVHWLTPGSHTVSVNYANPAGCPVYGPVMLPVTVLPWSPVGITIAASANPSCPGVPVTFTATAVNGGINPSYYWKKGNLYIPGATNSTYTFVPAAGDAIACMVTSSAACAANNPAVSAPIVMALSAPLPVSVNISAPTATLCAGTPVTFTATTVNGGSSPAYQWRVNGNNANNATNATYTFTPVNGDAVTCVMTSNFACVTGNPAVSNAVVMTVNPLLPAAVSISTPVTSVCAGTPVTFTATAVNGGSNPVYQWKVNAINANNATNATYTYTPANGDVVTCVMTSDAACVTGSPATSNAVSMTVNPLLPAAVTIGSTATAVCEGTPVTFTATAVNGGSSPAYQWKVNANNATNATNATYTYTPANGDVVTCAMTSNALCTTGNPAVSNTVAMTVNAQLPATVTIAASASAVCAGTAVTFSATPANGGSNPAYQWKVNANNANNATNATYTYTPANGDVVTCVMTSNAACATGNPAMSNAVAITVTSSQATITGPFSMCLSSAPKTYTTEPGMTGYAWSISSGGTIVSGQGTSTLIVVWSVEGIQSVGVSYTNGGCTVIPALEQVTVIGTPLAAGPVSGPAAVCSGATGIVYSVSPVTNATTYLWTLPPGVTVTAGTGTATITVSFPATVMSGMITVKGSNPCNSGGSSPPLAVQTNPSYQSPMVLENVIIPNTDEMCMTAQSITTGGNGSYFLVNGGSDLKLMASEYIRMLPGTKVQLAGHLVALINNTCIPCSGKKESTPSAGEPAATAAATGHGGVMVYPNPTDGTFTVEASSAGLSRAEVYSSTGVRLTVREIRGERSVRLSLENRPAGVYFIKAVTTGGVETLKIIKR